MDNIDLTTLQSIGEGVGLDITSIYNKYRKLHAHTQHTHTQQQQELLLPPPPPPRTEGPVKSTTTHDCPTLVSSRDTSRLDKYEICWRCQGVGLRKYFYNFQVFERNCDECSGDGLKIRGQH